MNWRLSNAFGPLFSRQCFMIELPGHSSSLHSITSVELPGQTWLLPDSGSKQARALILIPSPHVAVHSDHSPQSCHWAGTTGEISLNKSGKHHFVPGHSVSSHSFISVEFPGHTGLLPDSGSWQARALVLSPSPHVVVHSDHSPQSCHWAGTTTIFWNKI